MRNLYASCIFGGLLVSKKKVLHEPTIVLGDVLCSSSFLSSSDFISKSKNEGVRIKVVLTKQQFRQLLSNHNMRVETMIMKIDKKPYKSSGLLSNHLQKLEPIIEENE